MGIPDPTQTDPFRSDPALPCPSCPMQFESKPIETHCITPAPPHPSPFLNSTHTNCPIPSHTPPNRHHHSPSPTLTPSHCDVQRWLYTYHTKRARNALQYTRLALATLRRHPSPAHNTSQQLTPHHIAIPHSDRTAPHHTTRSPRDPALCSCDGHALLHSSPPRKRASPVLRCRSMCAMASLSWMISNSATSP